MNDTTHKKFFHAKWCFILPLCIFVAIIVGLFEAVFPTVDFFDEMHTARMGFNRQLFFFLYFVVFFLVDFFIYCKKSCETRMVYEWIGTVVVLVAFSVVAVVHWTTEKNDCLNTEEFAIWSTCLEKNGFEIPPEFIDSHSLLEPQSWMAITCTDLTDNSSDPYIRLYFVDCTSDFLAQNYRFQFLKEYKDSELHQHVSDGITHIVARNDSPDAACRWRNSKAALLIYQKTVIMLEIQGGDSALIDEVFSTLVPSLPDLFVSDGLRDKTSLCCP